MITKFFTWLCRFSFKQIAKRPKKLPTGIPYHRDPDSICRAYFPVKQPSNSGPCKSDGHYLCNECEWRAADIDESE